MICFTTLVSIREATEMNGVKLLKIDVDLGAAGTIPVSALLIAPADSVACFVFAHGAGAGMTHAFMEMASRGLGERGIPATLRLSVSFHGERRQATGYAAGLACRSNT